MRLMLSWSTGNHLAPLMTMNHHEHNFGQRVRARQGKDSADRERGLILLRNIPLVIKINDATGIRIEGEH